MCILPVIARQRLGKEIVERVVFFAVRGAKRKVGDWFFPEIIPLLTYCALEEHENIVFPCNCDISMRSVSHQRKVGDWFCPEIIPLLTYCVLEEHENIVFPCNCDISPFTCSEIVDTYHKT
jgi:hypothetical protein